jgi:hypothetical protein
VYNTQLIALFIFFEQLQPRSVPFDLNQSDAGTMSPRRHRKTLSSKGNPFGDAIPREEVLQRRGLDPIKVDQQFETKCKVIPFTRVQEAELQKLQAELTKATLEWQQANELELPEERLRLEAEAKRKELHDTMQGFKRQNAQVAKTFSDQPTSPSSPSSKLSGRPRLNLAL